MSTPNPVERIVGFLIETVEEIGWRGDLSLTLPLDENMPLVGDDSVLDSRALVELLIALEEYLEDEFGGAFDWTTDRALSRTNSPFRTAKTLAQFAASQAKL